MQTTIETELTRRLWEHWQRHRTKPQLTWLELHKLAEHLTRTVDYRAVDFQTLIDPQLSYYENLDALHMQFHQLGQTFELGFNPEGTEKLRAKYQRLTARYRHMQKRLKRWKDRNKRLKNQLERKRGRRRKNARGRV